MKFKDLLDEAAKELTEENQADAKAVIKERLREIKETEKVLANLRKSMEKVLEEDVE